MRPGNEDEHSLGAATIPCYDAVVAEVARINPSIVPVGPELVGDDPTQSALLRQFLNSSNHANGRAPPVVSFHLGSDSQDAFWTDWDGFLYGPQKCDEKTTECTGVVPWYESLREPGTEFVINEFIPFISDFCDSDHCSMGGPGDDPNLADGKGSIRMNRKTWNWHAAGAYFAYAFGTLSERRFKYVGVDQLIGGPWPDNEASVSCLDWVSGQPNAKSAPLPTPPALNHAGDLAACRGRYWVVHLLAQTCGTSAEKVLFNHTVSGGGADKSLYVMPYAINGSKGMLLVNKAAKPVEVLLEGVGGGSATAVEVDPSSAEPAFEPQVRKPIVAGRLRLGPYAVAVVTEMGPPPGE